MSHLTSSKFRFPIFANLAALTILLTLALTILGPNGMGQSPTQENSAVIKVGIIGLDTSHSIAFTEALNAKNPEPALANCRVVAAYPQGSADIKSSVERIPGYTEKIKTLGVEVVDSIEALLKRCDAVLLETNDGRPHLEQLIPCLKAGKRTFVDKPVAGSLNDAVKMFKLSQETGVPFFTSSALRFSKTNQAARAGEFGKVQSAWTTSPASVESTHPLLYWYGIHGVESLFTVMGPGCEKVSCQKVDGKIVARGVWSDGRVGEFREGTGYTGKVATDKGEFDVGSFDGYKPLVVEIVKFFRSGEVPVSPEESLEIYAFMSAAEESLNNAGKEVSLK
jgi:predicted dehydrogenase